MAFFVSDGFAGASDLIKYLMQIVIVILIPCFTALFLIISVPNLIFGGCNGYSDDSDRPTTCRSDNKRWWSCINKRVIGISENIFCFLKRNDSENHFSLFGYKAPVCYTYILLYLTVIVVIHSFFTFWDSAFHNSTNTIINNWDPSDRHTYCIDIFNVTQKAFPLLNDTEDLTCIEVHLLEGLENAATTFGLSAIAVAIITWMLLTCSQGNKTCNREERVRMLVCIPVITLFQGICLFVPRIVFLYYLYHITVANIYWSYDSMIDAPIPAVTNEESLFASIAILDAISLTMLTPWFNFEKIETKSN